MKKIALLIFLLQFMSCGIVDDDNIKGEERAPKEFSLSPLKYYMNLNTITRNNTISPNLVCHLDTVNSFSVGFVCDVKHLYTKETSKIKASVKYYLPRPGSVSVVCSVSKADSVIYWKALPLNSSIAINKWATSDFEFVFPQTYAGNEQLAVYVWAPNKDEAYIEDIYVRAEK